MANRGDKDDALIGQVVGGRYEVVRLIGEGGVGAIYEVRNIRLGRSFALKTLTGDASAEALQRFRREAEIVARIKHPNIVDIIDWDELADGSPCIVMEYLKGEDLASRISSDAPLPWPLIAQVGDSVLAALAVTHASGVVHRDLKPQNVFLALDDAGDEQVKLLDFGVSKFHGTPSVVTTDAKLIGTPAYMAPEQAQGQAAAVGTHTDVWAMAIMLHEMATGVRAFTGPNMPATLYAICHGEPASIIDHRPDAPPAFINLIADALVRSPTARLADAAEMRRRLREALAIIPAVQSSRVLRSTPPRGIEPVRPVRARSEEDALADTARSSAALIPPPGARVPPPAAPKPTRSRRYALVAAGGVAIAGGVVAVVLSQQQKNEPAPKQVAVVPVRDVDDAAMLDAAIEAPPVDAAATSNAERAVPNEKPVDKQPVRRPPEPASPEKLYVQSATKAIGKHHAPLLACFNANPGITETIKVTIEIGANGRAKQVSFAPEHVQGSPLGACLRAEIMRAEFPTGDRDQTFSIPLRATAR
jgi:serine/threonine-protein kinase